MRHEAEERRDEPLDEVLQAAIRALPRERESGLLLEERTVRALRARGVLATGGQRRIPRAWLAAGMAASIALFVSGVAVGQWVNGRQAATVIGAQQQSLEEMSSLVERTGAAYVSALSQLAETNASGAGSTVARQTALQVLHQAANEVVRLAPNDPVAVKILQGFDHAALQTPPADTRERRRQIVWF